MKQLLIATRNPGKFKELSAFLHKFDCVSLESLGIENDVVEDGATFEENSQKKALFFAKRSGLPTIADDGGLMIDALHGEPGVKSRRWLGYEATDEELRKHLEKVIRSLPSDRKTARLTTVISFALPTGEFFSERSEIVGQLSTDTKASAMKGYPFRAFFYIPRLQKFYTEQLTAEETKQINHRHKALSKLLPTIRQHLEN